MSKKLKLYVWLIILMGLAVTFFPSKIGTGISIEAFLVFLVLSIIAESLSIPSGIENAVTFGFAINLAAILVLGVPYAAIIASVGIMFSVVNQEGKWLHLFNTPFHKTLYNGATSYITVFISGSFYSFLGGSPGSIDFSNNVIPLLACVIVHVIINETLSAGLMSIITNEKFIRFWIDNFLWAMKDCIFVAPLGVLMALTYLNFGTFGSFLFLGPLLLARYSYKLYFDMAQVYLQTVTSLSQAMEAKDMYTQGHANRVSDYSCYLAKELNLSIPKIKTLKMAAILHDIGKIGIEDAILNKPGRLTDEEFIKIKQHSQLGYKIIQEISYLKDASEIVLYHHERYDGLGYPFGKKNGEIPIEAEILSISDVYDALTTERPYRHALTHEEAISIIKSEKNKQFSGKIVDLFIKMLSDKYHINAKNKELKNSAG